MYNSYICYRYYPESNRGEEVYLPQSKEIHFPITKFGSLSPSLSCVSGIVVSLYLCIQAKYTKHLLQKGGDYIVHDKHATNTQSSATGLPNQVCIYFPFSLNLPNSFFFVAGHPWLLQCKGMFFFDHIIWQTIIIKKSIFTGRENPGHRFWWTATPA